MLVMLVMNEAYTANSDKTTRSRYSRVAGDYVVSPITVLRLLNNNNNRRLVTLAEHTSDHGRQTNSSTEEKGEQV